MGFYEFFGVTKPFDPDCTFVTSHILSPLALGLFRLTLAIYALVSLLIIIIYNGVKLHNLNSFFSYFTNLCYIGMTSYFWASSVQTLAFSARLRKAAVSKTRITEGREYPLQQWPRFLQLLHVFLACTIFVFPFVVTIVFWTLLANGAFSSEINTWKNITVHALNSVFALLEILLSRIVPRWANIVILILVLGGYIGVAYITHATQGFYTYSFLDPSHGTGKLVGYIIGIPVAAIIILAIVKGVCWIRDKIFASRTSRVSDDEYSLREKAGSSA